MQRTGGPAILDEQLELLLTKRPRLQTEQTGEQVERARDVVAARRDCREKQEAVIAEKRGRQVRTLPGRLVRARAAAGQGRVPLRVAAFQWTEVGRLTWHTAEQFRFTGADHFSAELLCGSGEVALGEGAVAVLSEEGELGAGELGRALLASPGVQPDLVPRGWLEHHYRWIVWNLSWLEARLGRPGTLAPGPVMDRLRYRYDRELAGGERSLVRRITEG